MTRSFDVFFDLCRNKRLSKQSWGWWFETPSRPLWRHRNGIYWKMCSRICGDPLYLVQGRCRFEENTCMKLRHIWWKSNVSHILSDIQICLRHRRLQKMTLWYSWNHINASDVLKITITTTTYRRQAIIWNNALFQIMACRLYDPKPLS